jgi:hypothetical protein
MEYSKAFKLKAKSPKLKAFLICFLLSALSFQQSQAQTFAEWFSQGKTQIKYLEQQIVALNALRVSMEQCYGMLKNEWGTISNFKNAELGLHQTYYTSLSQVNPVVKNSTNITSVQAEQESIISQFNGISNVNGLQTGEQSYINAVAQGVETECNQDLTDLQNVLTQGQLVMSDDERIQRINKLTAAIKDKYLFTCQLATSIRLLVIQRNQDGNDTQTLNQLYGINE